MTTIEDLQKQIEELQNKNKQLQDELVIKNNKLDDLEQKLDLIDFYRIFIYDRIGSSIMEMLKDEFAEYYESLEHLQKVYDFSNKSFNNKLKNYNKFYVVCGAFNYIFCTADNKNVKIFDNVKKTEYEVECDFNKINQLTIFYVIMYLYHGKIRDGLNTLKNL